MKLCVNQSAELVPLGDCFLLESVTKLQNKKLPSKYFNPFGSTYFRLPNALPESGRMSRTNENF